MLLYCNILFYLATIIQISEQNADIQKSNVQFIKTLQYFDFQWYHVLITILVVFLLIVFLLKNTKLSYKNFAKDSEIETNVKEVRHYFLILGILLPVLEVFIEVFQIRLQSELLMTVTLGILAEIVYFTSAKNKFLQKNIQTLFVLFFFLMSGLYFFKTIFFPFEIITFAQLLIVLFFSYTIFRTTKQFYIFVFFVMALFTGLLFTNLIPLKTNIIYLYSIIIIFILNYVWRLSIVNSRDNLLFANNIVHNGSSLIIATNKFGEVSFCSDNIIKILGYKPEDAMGLGFWNLTQDEEFENSDYSSKYIEDKIYIRKVKCKNGDFKYIQWLDKKYHDNLYVGIGQDVTEQVNLQEKYKSIVQTATDIIYEADANGNFIFFNDVVKTFMGFAPNELLGNHFTSVVRDDYKSKVAKFYYKLEPEKNHFEILEFPILGKDNFEYWVSQKVTVKRNDESKIINFTAIVRDITALKKNEFKIIERQHKINAFNSALTKLTTRQTTAETSLDEILCNILTETAAVLKVDRISIWEKEEDKIICSKSFTSQLHQFGSGKVLFKKDFPFYFEAIDKGEPIIVNNVCEHETTKEFCSSSNNVIKSLLDVPVFTNGNLMGLICCEMLHKFVEWDAEDINFARSIAEIISISKETQKRKIAENAIKESELNFRLINEAIKDDFWLYDIWNKKYIYHSKNSMEIYELPPEAFYTGEHTALIKVHEEDVETYSEAYKSFNLQDNYEIEYRIILKDGSIKWIQEKSSAVRDEQGKLILNAGVSSDITQRKIAENALKESENNFRLLNETIDDVFWLYDLVARKILYISHSSKKVLGVSPKEFYETNNYWVNYILDEDKPAIIAAHEKIEKEGFFEVEYRIKTDTGIKWIFEKSFGIKDDKGKYIKSSGICSDITEKKQKDIQLKQLSIVAEKTSNGVLIADNNNCAIWANQAFLDMFEITLDELIGKRPSNLFNANNEAHLNEIQALAGKNFTKEIEVVTYLKKLKWVEVNNTSILDEKNNVVQQIEIVTDITEKVKHKNTMLQYSKDLEYQSVLQKKIINSLTYDELAIETLSFIKGQTKGCIRISLLSIDDKNSVLSGHLLVDDKLTKIRLLASDTSGFNNLLEGKIYIEKDLRTALNKSVHDIEKISKNVISYILLPILSGSKLIGSLNISLDHPFDIAENQIKNLESFSILLSVALQQISLKNELFEKNKDTIDSLSYAQNIQNTILPEIKNMTNSFKDVCLYFKPRDIVSGDFYWAKEIDHLTFIAIADCTGHGVPGAFLTLIGSRLLEQIVSIEKLTNPAEILESLDDQIYLSLNSKENDIIRDGMEISFCTIDKKNKKIYFAGAGLGLIYFLNDEEFYLKGQRKSIGDYRHYDFKFETTEINYTGNETFYMASDGFQDQLGGPTYKRFSKKRTIEVLKNIIAQPTNEKEKSLEKEMKDFIGSYQQTDDITVLGFKLI